MSGKQKKNKAKKQPEPSAERSAGRDSPLGCTPKPDLQSIASATECTGALPALPPEE